jgi:hypothetical protein
LSALTLIASMSAELAFRIPEIEDITAPTALFTSARLPP